MLVTDEGLTVADMFSTTILWMNKDELVPGRNYFVKVGTQVLPGTVMSIKHKIDINTGERVPVNRAFKNELVVCGISVSDNLAFDNIENNKVTAFDT